MAYLGILKDYYYLTKPGIIRGNLLTASAGFFLASTNSIDLWLYLAMVAGLSFVIGSGCTFNNYIDREIDKKMERTKNRALVQGRITPRNALIFGSTLLLLGLFILAFFANILTSAIALFGFIFYVVIYGIWKRRSSLGTAVGSISGAVPPVVGYCAVSNQIDAAAVLLFLILVFWQMPHFYAISIFRKKEYQAASIPVLSIEKGLYQTKRHIIIYIFGFSVAALSLFAFNYTGYIYVLVMAILCAIWLRIGLEGFSSKNINAWARKMFGFSLTVLSTFSLLICLNALLP